jgi:hypothetical protein
MTRFGRVDFSTVTTGPNSERQVTPYVVSGVESTEGLAKAVQDCLHKILPQARVTVVVPPTDDFDMTLRIESNVVPMVAIDAIKKAIKGMKKSKHPVNLQEVQKSASAFEKPNLECSIKLDEFEDAVKAWTTTGIVDDAQLAVLMQGFQAIHKLTKCIPYFKLAERAALQECMSLGTVQSARSRG